MNHTIVHKQTERAKGWVSMIVWLHSSSWEPHKTFSAYLLIYSLRVQPGTEFYDDEVRRVVVDVVSVVVAQRVVDLESQLAPGSIERGAAHVSKEHFHRDLEARVWFWQRDKMNAFMAGPRRKQASSPCLRQRCYSTATVPAARKTPT